MAIRFLTRLEVSAARGHEAKASTYKRIQDGLLPEPVKIGSRSLWPSHEIHAINMAILGGATEDKIRELVKQLMDLRPRMAAKTDDEIDRLLREWVAQISAPPEPKAAPPVKRHKRASAMLQPEVCQ